MDDYATDFPTQSEDRRPAEPQEQKRRPPNVKKRKQVVPVEVPVPASAEADIGPIQVATHAELGWKLRRPVRMDDFIFQFSRPKRKRSEVSR